MHRPSEIGNWIKNARKGYIEPANRDLFAQHWLKWWAHLNPEWRERVGDRVVQGDQSGDWRSMIIPGANGFLSVLSSLVPIVKGADLELARYAAGDVAWVIDQVVAVARARAIG